MIVCSCSNTSENDRYAYSLESIERPITKRWIQGFEAAKAASECSDGFKNRDKMGSAIFFGSRLLSIGFNQYSKIDASTKKQLSMHAEKAALSKIKYRNYESVKLICYVVRMNSKNQYVVSKPCKSCITALTEGGIHSVRFVNSNGNAEEIFLQRGN